MAAPTRKISLVIADDHRVVRTGLRLLLERVEEIEVVGETGDAAEALALARAGVDVLLLDLNMPGKPLEALAELAGSPAGPAVVVLTIPRTRAASRDLVATP